MLSNHASINITIIDSNDNAPVFSSPSYSSVVREDASMGQEIVSLTASDQDGGDNGRLTFTILFGDRHSQFRIDSETGMISVGAQLDREMIANYVLEIEARDNGIPSLASNVLVTIQVLDANDNQPMFVQANYTAIAQEDKPLGFTILQLQVNITESNPISNAFHLDFY